MSRSNWEHAIPEVTNLTALIEFRQACVVLDVEISRNNGFPFWHYLEAFEDDTALVERLKAQYRRGGLGDGVIKGILEERLQALLASIRTCRQRLAADAGGVLAMLRQGTTRARETLAMTLKEVKQVMGLDYFSRHSTSLPEASTPRNYRARRD